MASSDSDRTVRESQGISMYLTAACDYAREDRRTDVTLADHDYPSFLCKTRGPIKVLCQLLTFFDQTQIPADIARAYMRRCGREWEKHHDEMWNRASRELLHFDGVVYHLLDTPTTMIQEAIKKDKCKRMELLFEAAQFLVCYAIDKLDKSGQLFEDVMHLIPHFLAIYEHMIHLGLHFRFIAQVILTSKYRMQYIAFPFVTKLIANTDSWDREIEVVDSLKSNDFHQYYQDFRKLVTSMTDPIQEPALPEWAIHKIVEGSASLGISKRACHCLLKACLDFDCLLNTVEKIVRDPTLRAILYPDDDPSHQSRYHHLLGVLLERQRDAQGSADEHRQAVQLAKGTNFENMYIVFQAEALLQVGDEVILDETIRVCERTRMELRKPERRLDNQRTLSALTEGLRSLSAGDGVTFTLEGGGQSSSREAEVRDMQMDGLTGFTIDALQKAIGCLAALCDEELKRATTSVQFPIDMQMRPCSCALPSYCCCVLALGYSLKGQLNRSLDTIAEAAKHIKADKERRGGKRLANVFYFLAKVLLQKLRDVNIDPEKTRKVQEYAANCLMRSKLLHHPEHYKQRFLDDLLKQTFKSEESVACMERPTRTRLDWEQNIDLLLQTIGDIKTLCS